MFRYEPCRPGRQWILYGGLFFGSLMTTLNATAQDPPGWTLDEAVENALAHSPVLRAQQAALKEIESRLVGAKTYPYNPEISLEVADRRSPGGASTDRGLSLSQEIEVAGQRRQRIAVADTKLAAAKATLLRQQRLLIFRVASAFATAIRTRELQGVAEADAALAREVRDFSQRRLERGAATQIEFNLAQASAGRAGRSVQRARADYASARSRLATLAGLDPATSPAPLGDLVLPEGDLPPLATLLKQARANRGDLQSGQQQEQAAEAAIRLALAERRPNLVLGGFVQREEGTDDIFGATVAVSLPLFNRDQGPVAEARATRERLRYEQEARRLTVEQEVIAALNNLQAARAATTQLRDQVLGTLEENVDLLQRSFAAGRIGATEVVTLRREFVASRREYVEALADAWLARIELELAIGQELP